MVTCVYKWLILEIFMEKKIHSFNLLCFVGWVTGCLFLMTSCGSSKKIVYFPNVGNGTVVQSAAEIESVIQKNDILSISVSSPNPEATLMFNNTQTVISSTATGSISQSIGYLVNNEGNIDFPGLGTISAIGLTKKQLTQKISSELVEKKLLIEPIVNIRFLNYRVTILGEVSRPTVLSVANEKISLLEALGLAGDLTLYAKRDNILLIREEGGKKIFRRINLNSDDFFSSQYYYLKTNDIVYVEPNRVRAATANGYQQNLPVVFSALSLLVIIAQYLIQK